MCADVVWQVGILSEGRCVFFGSPSMVVDWFDKQLGYFYSPSADGSVSDWVIDLVSPRGSRPLSLSWVYTMQSGLAETPGAEVVKIG